MSNGAVTGMDKALFQTILDNVIDGIITTDDRGIVHSFNAAAERIFGYRAPEVIGENVKMLMPQPYQAEHDGYVKAYLRTGEAKIIGIGREVSGLHRDGHTFPIELGVSEFHAEDRRMFAGIIRDITERREAERALGESEAHLRALQFQHTELERLAVAGEMAAIVAHEIRTPLNALSINVQMIARMLKRPSQDGRKPEDLLRTLRDEVERINQLLEDYLRVVRRPQERSVEQLAINELVRDAIQFIGHKAARSDVQVVSHLAPRLPAVQADPAQLRQVLLNILLNALQAMPDGGELHLTTCRHDEKVCVRVRDTGPGISDEDRERIFRPFVTTKPKGTGLGLAICDRIVKQMGGSLRLVARGEPGACFEVLLPPSKRSD